MRLLRLAASLSSFDRFVIAPLLVTLAVALGVSLADATLAASLYYLFYGLMQPVWGMLSDRLGRVRVMRLALLGAALCGLLSAFSPNLAALVALRALTGGFFAAIIPASLVYIGDTVPIKHRQRELADLMAGTAVGTALAIVGAGLLASVVGGWRVAFAVPAVSAALLSLLLVRLPEPEREKPEGPLAQIGKFFKCPWAVLVVSIAVVEGAIMLGFLTFLAPALEASGYAPATAGLAVGLYGLAVLGWTRVLRRLTSRVGPARLILAGGAMMAVGYAAAALEGGFLGVGVAAILVGGCQVLMHSTLQNWATEVAPEARATVISFFAAGLFIGSGVATTLAAPLADAGAFGPLFSIAALAAVPLALVATLARRRYRLATSFSTDKGSQTGAREHP